jgi:2-polyprenyl-6-methoxyphenol hydroxylase-like FAD-dependent oxidoreductase
MVSEIKEVTSDNKVEVTCADGSKYLGDILVGADGAYSTVRQCLYRQLDTEGVLPSSDKRDLNCGFVTMVGTTDPLDHEKYPALKDEYSFFAQVIGTNKPYSVRSTMIFFYITDIPF